MGAEKVKVVFIGGYGRSGSTLLDRVLGQHKGFCSIGELRYLWERGLLENRLCGCGDPVAQCSLWTSVLEEVFSECDEKPKFEEIAALQKAVDRIRYIPLMIWPNLRRKTFNDILEKYLNLLYKVYLSIKKVTGCEVIVDSSKDPSHGFILSLMKEIDLRIVHLVRDSRAVAHSWQRKKRNWEIKDRIAYMRTLHPLESALMWETSNILMEFLAHRIDYYVKVRYEDLIKNPKGTISWLLRELGLHTRDLDYISDSMVNLSRQTHNISGNPSKFAKGEVQLRLDREWITALPLRYKALVTIVTFPLLYRYGYFSRWEG